MSKMVYGISGEDNSPNLPIEDIENERIFLVGFLLDKSGSMSCHTGIMPDCLEMYKKIIMNSKQSDEMLVSLTTFGGGINQGGYQLVELMPTDYYASGGTPLYDCIIQVQQSTFDGNGNGYLEELRANGVKAQALFVIFSDGRDEGSNASQNEAKEAIRLLQSQEITVAFVAFGDQAKGIAQGLGIDPANIKESNATKDDLINIFGELSKSSVSASKNAASGQSNQAFFV